MGRVFVERGAEYGLVSGRGGVRDVCEPRVDIVIRESFFKEKDGKIQGEPSGLAAQRAGEPRPILLFARLVGLGPPALSLCRRRTEEDNAAFQQLEAAFRALILDWHEKLEAKGEGDHMYLYFTTRTGTRREEIIDQDGRILRRDIHGGGYHGGWGGAARMRVYEELAAQGALSDSDQERFRRLVYQSMEKRFIDFKAKTQAANNHSYGNAGGVALALKLFPDAPQADEAGAWIDRIWRHLSDFGDWKEWNYYPYGPIFLHGLLDIAEATGRIDSDRALIQTIGDRCLGFVRAGVRGNPNCGSPTRKERSAVYEDPWNVGCYEVETSARDAHFWRRMARHFEKPEYLWAAEQVSLGGRSPDGDAPREYEDAYRRAFGWFADRGIHPRAPSGGAGVGMLSPGKRNIPERLYLSSSREPGAPFASFFLYDKKEAHLDNLGGFFIRIRRKRRQVSPLLRQVQQCVFRRCSARRRGGRIKSRPAGRRP